jgi:hypothetical protein
MSKSSTKHFNIVLEPNQSAADYRKLKKKWDEKLASSGFKDIEYVDSQGHASRYSRDYCLYRLGENFSEDKLEYYRRAGIFLQEFNFKTLRSQVNPRLAKFIWAHYAAGYTMRDIEKVLKLKQPSLLKGRVPRKRTVKGPQMPPASLFFIFKTINRVLYPAFQSWCEKEKHGLLASDFHFGA